MLLLISFYIPYLIFYLNFVLVFFAALGLVPFINNVWKSYLLKFLTLLIIFCGLLFSFLLFYNQINYFEPTTMKFDAINYLKSQPDDSVVVSSFANENYIIYAGKNNFIDSYTAYKTNFNTHLSDYRTLINSSDLNSSLELMDRYNVKYVLVDKDMKLKDFDNKDQGLLFLLRYTPNRFLTVFRNDDVEIWSRI